MNKKIIQQIWLPILLVLVCLSTPFTSVYAQNIRVTIQLKDVRMKQVMTEIEKQTRYLFAVDDDVDVTRSVSVNVINQPLQEALIQMVKGSDVSYQISGSNIVLKKQPIQQPVTVSGTVHDQHKQPIVGASIIVKGTAVGTSTNADGSFSLQIPPPVQQLNWKLIFWAMSLWWYLLAAVLYLTLRLKNPSPKSSRWLLLLLVLSVRKKL